VALTRRAGLAVRMRIEQLNLTDAGGIRACHEVFLAARQVDEPEGPRMRERVFGGWLTVGWGGDPREVWVAPGQAEGSAAGWYRLELPDRENLDRANLELIVSPNERRRGTGLALLRHAAGRAAAHGRAVLSGGAPSDSPGDAFARAVGAEPGLVDVQRIMEPGKLAEGTLTRLREQAEQAAAGYSLVSWTGLVPEELIEQTAALYAALGDAPQDPGAEPEMWDAQRVRELVNGLRPRYGLRYYSVAAVPGATGEMAALTEMAVDPADPGWGHQMITAVARKHRGHRLGLLVKAAMLELLAASEPQLERIVTWNARSNTHMIAVNEALGYTVLGPPITWWRLDVAAVQGLG
jgi:GNAT superfamily N-acetyltransferase